MLQAVFERIQRLSEHWGNPRLGQYSDIARRSKETFSRWTLEGKGLYGSVPVTGRTNICDESHLEMRTCRVYPCCNRHTRTLSMSSPYSVSSTSLGPASRCHRSSGS